MKEMPAYEVFPLGDAAITLDLGNRISEELNDHVLVMRQWLRDHSFEGMRDLVVGYSSLSVLYDPIVVIRKYKLTSSAFEFVKQKLEKAYQSSRKISTGKGGTIEIPVCYDDEFGPDLSFVAEERNLTIEEAIGIHSSMAYRVYMIGFLPGFAYMGKVDERIQVARKETPVSVKAGSIGIANGQTGIYPLDSPGGWQIIGRTPLKLFDASSSEQVLLKAGQQVRFVPISKHQFKNLVK